MCFLLTAKFFWSVVAILGVVTEIVGVALMANRYGDFRWWNYPIIFTSALVNGKAARLAASYAKAGNENYAKTLKGVVLLVTGFSIQLASMIGIMLTT